MKQVVLVPFPLTPLIAYGYYFLRSIGVIGASPHTRYHNSSEGNKTTIELGDGFILRMSQRDIYEYLTSYLTWTSIDDRALVRRFLTFFHAAPEKQQESWKKWVLRLSLHLERLSDVLDNADMCFAHCREIRLDPWRDPFPGGVLCYPHSPTPSYPTDKRFVTLPVMMSSQPGEKVITSVKEYSLCEGNVMRLRGRRLGIVVGGPSGSGKSTLVVSLAHELKTVIESLKTRRGWEGFSLRTNIQTLDRGTPTLDAIQKGDGQNRANLEKVKKPWTWSLAIEAAQDFRRVKDRCDILISDLPGGVPDAVTQITASHADIAILVTNQWDHMPMWQTFCRDMGLRVVAQVRSRSLDDGLPSIATRYHAGRMLSGRVVDLDRVNRSWDRFVSWLAEFLLFDILPSFVSKREEKLLQLLNE